MVLLYLYIACLHQLTVVAAALNWLWNGVFEKVRTQTKLLGPDGH
jgi:hypothetical protein